MNFLIKRYLYGISKRRYLLLLIALIPCLYLLFMAYQTDRFTVWQALSIPQDAPVALVTSPVGYQSLSDIVDNQESFFRNNYIVTMLLQETFGNTSMAWSGKEAADLIESVRNDMSIVISGNGRPQIQYNGKDKKTGEILVGYYANRLLRQTLEGYTRSSANEVIPLSISGPIETIGHKALWRNDRLVPLMSIFLLSLAGVMFMIWAMEWSDPSFKSERQMGRYLDLPVLGYIPDLNKVTHKMKQKQDVRRSEQPHPI